MALDGGGREPDIRSQFRTREGIYKKIPNSEYCRPGRKPYTAQGPPSSFTPVKASFADIEHDDITVTRIVFTIGQDLFYFNYEGVTKPVDLSKPLDKRTYKGVAPTCHDINRHSASPESVRVAVGFAAGQVQIIDVGTKQSLLILNEERMVDKVTTTCVKWVPSTEHLVISSHANGHMYTYDTSQGNINVVPQYHERPHKTSGDISVFTLKCKSYTSPTGESLGVLKNPMYKWTVTHDNSAIHEFHFSPDQKCIAIVSQDGYLRVVDYGTFEMKGSMKSYFGALLCCCWSPDGRYIVTGGEDDLVTVWSFLGGYVLARGHGHRSWVSNVAFDTFCCYIPEEDEVLNWYDGESHAFLRKDSKTEGRGVNEIRNKLPHRGKAGDGHECINENKEPLLCLGKRDPRSPVTELQSMARRQRTDSTVSKISRISLTGSLDAPPRISYRFGSVGQDAQLCLWELTDEVLFFRRRTISMLHSYGSVHGRGRDDMFCSHFLKPKHENEPVLINSSLERKDSFHSDSTSATTPEYKLQSGVTKRKLLKSNGLPNPGTPVKDHSSTLTKGFHFFSLSKDSKGSHSSVLNSGKFATIGVSNEHKPKKENIKEHKRNLSMPHFGSRNLHSNSSNGMTKTSLQNKKLQNIKTLGTALCPHMDETAMLEPLVCKRITQGRLTCLSFQKESIVTACQDGFVQTWARPRQQHNVPQQVPTSSLKHSSGFPNSPSSPKTSPSAIS